MQARSLKVRILVVSFEFFNYLILPAALCPWADSTPNRNEYQEYLLGGGVKAACA